MHGGSVQAFSAGLNQGSEFIVRLPAQAHVPPPPSPEERDPATASLRRRVLIVDDNLDAADSLGMLLRVTGHEVQLAHDGPSALTAASSFRPEVVLLDIGLPGMDGYEVARRLRRQEGSEKALLVALTGYGQAEDFRRSQEAGFDQHLVKPADPEMLTALFADLPQPVG
jgi:CheY-like chemotaxis protein